MEAEKNAGFADPVPGELVLPDAGDEPGGPSSQQ